MGRYLTALMIWVGWRITKAGVKWQPEREKARREQLRKDAEARLRERLERQ